MWFTGTLHEVETITYYDDIYRSNSSSAIAKTRLCPKLNTCKQLFSFGTTMALYVPIIKLFYESATTAIYESILQKIIVFCTY